MVKGAFVKTKFLSFSAALNNKILQYSYFVLKFFSPFPKNFNPFMDLKNYLKNYLARLQVKFFYRFDK